MVMIFYAIMILGLLLVVVKCLIYSNELNKQIDKILVEEKHQNKRIDVLEKREQMRQVEQRRDKAYIETKNLFKEW